MANTVPASLKTADITRFAHRAAQLEKPKPAIAYWCNYWILNQILSKGLHNVDAEALSYTTGLMDKVEQFKNTNTTNDAIVDEVAGKAYIEQFGLEIFGKADNAVRTNKVTTATADTFQAALTVLDLLAIWPPVEQEITLKIKYAKFHAVRILKAVKAGEDPNLSNPKQEPAPEEALPPLDPNDAEVMALGGTDANPRRASVVEIPDEAHRIQANLAKTSTLDESLHPSREQSQARPPRPSVTEIPDEAHRIQKNLARISTEDESLHPSRVPSRPTSATGNVSPATPQDASAFYTSNQHDISPIDAPSERKPSIGGNYFPMVSNQAPSGPIPPAAPVQPSASLFDLPSAPTEPTIPSPPNTFASQPSPSSTIPPPNANPDGHFIPPPLPGQPPQIPPGLTPSVPRQQLPTAPPQLRQTQFHPPPPPPPPPSVQPQQFTYAPPPTQPPQPPAPIAQPIPQPPVQSNIVVDEEAVLKAQKHARWAISALNFEDVPTAVRELRGALAALGAGQ